MALLPAKKPAATLSAHIGLFVTTAIWASTFVNIKVVLLQVPPNTLAFLRFLLASIILVLFSYLQHLPPIKKSDWFLSATSGFTGVALYNILQNQGLKYAGATDAAILASMAPVFMVLMAWLLLKERIFAHQVVGIIIAFTGSVLVATNGSFNDPAMNSSRLFGDILILLTALTWGFYNVSLKKLLDRYPAETVLTYSTLWGTLFLLPLVFLEAPDLGAINAWGWLHIIYLGLMASALAYLLWNRGLTVVSTATAGAYLYLLPVITALIAVIFLKETPTFYTVTGGLLALAGTYFAAK